MWSKAWARRNVLATSPVNVLATSPCHISGWRFIQHTWVDNYTASPSMTCTGEGATSQGCSSSVTQDTWLDYTHTRPADEVHGRDLEGAHERGDVHGQHADRVRARAGV